jgi:hypothetical protein
MVRGPTAALLVLLGVALAALAAYGQDGPIRINVKEDVQVRSALPDRNFGTATELYAGSYGAQVYRSFLKFDLSALPGDKEVKKAVLRVWHRFSGATKPDISVHAAGDGWSELQITWNNAPDMDDEACDTVTLSEGYTEYEWDVTEAVVGEVGSDGVATLVLTEAAQADAWARLFGKEEDPARAAYLLIDGDEGGADTTPPVIDLEQVKEELWPPNNKMVVCAVLKGVTDDQDPTPTVKGPEITSDEEIEGDWEVDENGEVKLRAERDATGDGRVYTITVTATDAAGNETTESVEVTVPHDQGQEKGKS